MMTRGRYVGIVSEAAARLSAAAGAPGEHTARGVGRKSKAAEAAAKKEEAKLDDLLNKCLRAATEWKTAEKDHGEKGEHGAMGGEERVRMVAVEQAAAEEVTGGEQGGGDDDDDDDGHGWLPPGGLPGSMPDALPLPNQLHTTINPLREQTNQLTNQLTNRIFGSPDKASKRRGPLQPTQATEQPPSSKHASQQSKQRRLARQAAAAEVGRLAGQCLSSAKQLSRRRSELSSLNGTLPTFLPLTSSFLTLTPYC